MDIVSAASTLRSQLVALQHSDITVSQLEQKVTSLNHQAMMTAIEDNQSKHLQLILRQSVNEGVCHMYKQFSNKKWKQVQNTARSIKASLEDGSSEQTLVLPSPSNSPDHAAELWTTVFCEHSRCE